MPSPQHEHYLHWPHPPHPDVPTLSVDYDDYLGFTFQCSSDHCDTAAPAARALGSGASPPRNGLEKSVFSHFARLLGRRKQAMAC